MSLTNLFGSPVRWIIFVNSLSFPLRTNTRCCLNCFKKFGTRIDEEKRNFLSSTLQKLTILLFCGFATFLRMQTSSQRWGKKGLLLNKRNWIVLWLRKYNIGKIFAIFFRHVDLLSKYTTMLFLLSFLNYIYSTFAFSYFNAGLIWR